MDDALEDDEFLSLVDAVEADVMKRRRVSESGSYNTQNYNTQNNGTNSNPTEGQYTAALRGSNSQLWQTFNADTKTNKRPAERSSYGTSGDICYKCQQPGHWAKDCVSIPAALNRGDDNASGVPEKQCPCGGGPCIVLTANTEKNPGRKFYKCPVREESARCGFFEWCDAAKSLSGGHGGQATAFNNDISKGPEPSLQCPCGAGLCSVLTAKTEKNMGRQFFRCPMKQGEGSCGFFKWCDEPSSTSYSSPGASHGFPSWHGGTPSNSGRTGPSPCYKCGIEGHWAKDCPKPLSSIIARSGTGHGENPHNTCFKCGQAGHWAKDCPSQTSDSLYGGREFSKSSHKRGGIDHQASSMYRSR